MLKDGRGTQVNSGHGHVFRKFLQGSVGALFAIEPKLWKQGGIAIFRELPRSTEVPATSPSLPLTRQGKPLLAVCQLWESDFIDTESAVHVNLLHLDHEAVHTMHLCRDKQTTTLQRFGFYLSEFIFLLCYLSFSKTENLLRMYGASRNIRLSLCKIIAHRFWTMIQSMTEAAIRLCKLHADITASITTLGFRLQPTQKKLK